LKATIKNSTKGPKAFYLDGKIKVLKPGEELQGDFEDGLLQALKNTGYDVDHKGELKLGESRPSKADTKAKDEAEKIIADAKAEAEKIIADAKAEAEKILAEAKATADKIISEAEELTKADK